MGKKLIAILLLLATILTVAGCAVKERDFDRTDRDKENTGSGLPILGGSEAVVQQPVPAEPSYATENQAAAKPAPQVVCYMHNTDHYFMEGTDYQTLAGEITFYDDNSFVMVVNLYEGWGNLTGSYYFESPGYFYCTVQRKDFSGFAGDNLQEFSLAVMSEGTYAIDLGDVYSIGMVESGEYFLVG